MLKFQKTIYFRITLALILCLLISFTFSLQVRMNQGTFEKTELACNTENISQAAAEGAVTNRETENQAVGSKENPDAGYIAGSYGTTGDMLLNRGLSERKLVEEKEIITGMISDDNVNFRNFPDVSSSDVIKSLNKGDRVNVIGRWGEWFKVEADKKTVGWINKDLISINERTSAVNGKDLLSEIPVEKPKEVIPAGQKLVNYSKKFLGVKYVWGGSTPKGFDCSGYVQYVYARFGVELERVAADQARQGIKVKRSSLKPGDLVFFDTDGGHSYINHVGIYIGGGKFIEASSGFLHRIKISDMSEGFYSETFMTARRFF